MLVQKLPVKHHIYNEHFTEWHFERRRTLSKPQNLLSCPGAQQSCQGAQQISMIPVQPYLWINSAGLFWFLCKGGSKTQLNRTGLFRGSHDVFNMFVQWSILFRQACLPVNFWCFFMNWSDVCPFVLQPCSDVSGWCFCSNPTSLSRLAVDLLGPAEGLFQEVFHAFFEAKRREQHQLAGTNVVLFPFWFPLRRLERTPMTYSWFWRCWYLLS